MRSLPLASAAAILAASLAAAQCDYYASTRCIKAQESATAAIPFAPLFTQAPTFVYAIDDLDENDKKTILEKEGTSIKLPFLQAIGIWLEFPPAALNFTPAAERKTQIAAIFTNATGSIGGSDNGCGNFLGAECVKNLRATIQLFSVGQNNDLVQRGFTGLRERPLRNLSCPVDLFDDYAAVPNRKS